MAPAGLAGRRHSPGVPRPAMARPRGEPRASRRRPAGMRRRESGPSMAPAGLAGRRHSPGVPRPAMARPRGEPRRSAHGWVGRRTRRGLRPLRAGRWSGCLRRSCRVPGSPKRELREYALPHRERNRIPSARASGFKASRRALSSRRMTAKQSEAGCPTPTTARRRRTGSRSLPGRASPRASGYHPVG